MKKINLPFTFIKYLLWLLVLSEAGHAVTLILVNSVDVQTGKPVEYRQEITSAEFVITDPDGLTLALFFENPGAGRYNTLKFRDNNDAKFFKSMISNSSYQAHEVYIKTRDTTIALGDGTALPFNQFDHQMRIAGSIKPATCSEHSEDVTKYIKLYGGSYLCRECGTHRTRKFRNKEKWGKDFPRSNELYYWITTERLICES